MHLDRVKRSGRDAATSIPWATRAQARTAIFEYIEGWYNPHRRHSKLGYLSPAEYERAQDETASQTTPAVV